MQFPLDWAAFEQQSLGFGSELPADPEIEAQIGDPTHYRQLDDVERGIKPPPPASRVLLAKGDHVTVYPGLEQIRTQPRDGENVALSELLGMKVDRHGLK